MIYKIIINKQLVFQIILLSNPNNTYFDYNPIDRLVSAVKNIPIDSNQSMYLEKFLE